MKSKLFSLLLTGSMFMASSPLALVQAQGTVSDWSAVQRVGTDERLIVKQKDGKTVEGRMIEASETNLTLSRNGKVINISRDGILQIHHSKGQAAKGKWALIGAGIGGAAGAGIGATRVSADRDDSEIWVPVGLIFGSGAGAITGLLFGASRRQRELIYMAP
jgi:hypothetical protein